MMLQKEHWSAARNALRLGLSILGALSAAFSQSAFEVASVKPSQSAGARFTMSGGPGTNDPGRISYTNIMLKRVLLAAYDVGYHQILGPDWLDTLRFDITAKVPDGAGKEQFQSMLRNLLATRFQMAAHQESKELPIYALLAAKSGIKMKVTVDPDGAAATLPEAQLAIVYPGEGQDGFPAVSLRSPGLVMETKSGRARLTAKEVPISKLTDWLSGRLDRPAVDMTGLGGNYSFVLYFAAEGAGADGAPEPDIFAALPEQLGLRLEPRKGPVELLVIDHAEKVPTGN
jgi:uncharacterized protein (TIGR03435 family)